MSSTVAMENSPMNDIQIITAFLELLQEDFSKEALENLPQLAQNLEQYPDDAFDSIADVIVNWCASCLTDKTLGARNES